MSAQMIGAAVGALVGLTGFVFLRMLASKIEREKGEAGRQQALYLRMLAIVDVILMTALGAYAGPHALGG